MPAGRRPTRTNKASRTSPFKIAGEKISEDSKDIYSFFLTAASTGSVAVMEERRSGSGGAHGALLSTAGRAQTSEATCASHVEDGDSGGAVSSPAVDWRPDQRPGQKLRTDRTNRNPAPGGNSPEVGLTPPAFPRSSRSISLFGVVADEPAVRCGHLLGGGQMGMEELEELAGVRLGVPTVTSEVAMTETPPQKKHSLFKDYSRVRRFSLPQLCFNSSDSNHTMSAGLCSPQTGRNSKMRKEENIQDKEFFSRHMSEFNQNTFNNKMDCKKTSDIMVSNQRSVHVDKLLTDPGDSAIITEMRTMLAGIPNRVDFDLLSSKIEKIIEDKLMALSSVIAALDQRVSVVEAEKNVLNSKMAALNEKLTSVVAKNDFLHQSLSVLRLEVDENTNQIRRRNIRIRGIPSKISNDKLHEIVPKILNSFLGRDEREPVVIDKIRRLVHNRNSPHPSPGDVICCMNSFSDREQLLRNSWEKKLVEFEGSKISLFPDLSSQTLNMRRLMKPLLQLIRDKGASYRWGYPFHLIIKNDNSSFKLTHPIQLQDAFLFIKASPIEIPDWLQPLEY